MASVQGSLPANMPSPATRGSTEAISSKALTVSKITNCRLENENAWKRGPVKSRG